MNGPRVAAHIQWVQLGHTPDSRAEVDAEKVRDHLLSPSHPIGRFKARFFRTLGYARDHWERLRDDLLRLAETGVAARGLP